MGRAFLRLIVEELKGELKRVSKEGEKKKGFIVENIRKSSLVTKKWKNRNKSERNNLISTRKCLQDVQEGGKEDEKRLNSSLPHSVN